jgi:hypothetical protein
MSHMNQMREFAGSKAGQTFSATELAKALGWRSSKRARSLARKCGATVTKVERKIHGKGEDFRVRDHVGYDVKF